MHFSVAFNLEMLEGGKQQDIDRFATDVLDWFDEALVMYPVSVLLEIDACVSWRCMPFEACLYFSLSLTHSLLLSLPPFKYLSLYSFPDSFTPLCVFVCACLRLCVFVSVLELTLVLVCVHVCVCKGHVN